MFRTNPDKDDRREAQFLAKYEIGDAHLAKVIELLTRSRSSNGDGKIFVDYSSLDVRHLGSIYEGLLEYKLNVADEPLAHDDGEYVSAGSSDAIVVEEGEVYLTTGSGERKATGSYYTPEYVVEYIVENTLEPLVTDIREDLLEQSTRDDALGFAEQFADRVFELNVLDPAMGSGHFLINAIDYLAREIIDAQERQAAQQGIETVDAEHDINWARRQVAQRCIYGVDLNPLAVELSKVSLWLRTLAAEQPLAFLDHYLKAGNSLVGSDIEDVLSQNDGATESGQLTLQQSFAHTRQQALEHVIERFTDLLSIDNETLEDIKEMEEVYDEVRDDPLYQHLLAMANVDTAEKFGLDVPSDVYERMAEALRDDSWKDIERQNWFKRTQAMADEKGFFHWELEFPVSFYNDDGERLPNAGFDAVIGNPPYGMIDDELAEGYFSKQYRVSEGRNERYKLFTERSYELAKQTGKFGYIVSNTLFTNRFDQKIRNLLLSESSLSSIVTFEGNVFDDPTIHPAIFVSEKEEPADSHTLRLITGASVDSGRDAWTERSVEQSRYLHNEHNIITVISDAGESEVWYKMSEGDIVLGEIAHIRQCIKTGDNDQYLEEFEEKPDDPWKPILTGSDVQRYYIEWPQRYVKYGDWLARNWQNKDFYERSKIAIRETSDRITAALDTSERYLLSTLYSVYYKPEFDDEDSLEYLLAIINSTPAQFYMHQLVFALTEGAFTKARTNHYERLPIPIIDQDYTVPVDSDSREVLELDTGFDGSELPVRRVLIVSVEKIRELKDRRHSLNLSLLDYLGNYAEGPKLPDVGLFQPTSSNILDATTEDYEKLQVENVRTKRDSHSVAIEVTARYKPENEDEYETDSWGYTETDFFEAFTLADLTAKEAALVEAFVPVAIKEEIGGFRDNATKNYSMIDRLKDIMIPDIDDVQNDLQRFIETMERADKLDGKIEKIDRLIDEIVYDLYDLTGEEIEIVESAVQDD